MLAIFLVIWLDGVHVFFSMFIFRFQTDVSTIAVADVQEFQIVCSMVHSFDLFFSLLASKNVYKHRN